MANRPTNAFASKLMELESLSTDMEDVWGKLREGLKRSVAVREITAGRFLAHERMPLSELSVVLDGKLVGLRAAGDGWRYQRIYRRGDVVGGELLTEPLPVSHETVEVAGTAHLAVLDRDALEELRRRDPEVHDRLQLWVKNRHHHKEECPEPSHPERDLLGERLVPDSARYGIQTLRAFENFPISGTPVSHYPGFIVALAMVKKACACANRDLGLLPEPLFEAIGAACDTLIAGKHHRHFIVDVMQGGAGTSTNMMANEVVASLAREHLGADRSDYSVVHPNNHVNLGQSTNDVYPTAFRVSARIATRRLRVVLEELVKALAEKGQAFDPYVKLGRTQLQDAVPMTLGQEFRAFSATMREELDRLADAERLLEEINMGATAIGTGINAPAGFGERVRAHLEHISGMRMVLAPNLVEATQDTGAYIQLSSTLKRTAVKLSKICNDLRLLSSGPRGGLNEIQLPEAQPGSSIMPGKVNPVIPEVVNQVAFEIVGNDVTITMAAEAGQLQLNAMEPVIFWSLFKSIHHLRQAVITLTHRCVKGIEAHPEVARRHLDQSVALITALAPSLGYARTSELARLAVRSGRSAREVLEEAGLKAELDALFPDEATPTAAGHAPLLHSLA